MFNQKHKLVKIISENVTFIPYKKKFVVKYHEWMKDSELQYLTSSEPLSLNEEFEMQKKWSIDEDKLTFIILDNDLLKIQNNQVDSMIGDINLFLNKFDKDDQVEIELMIAEKNFRGKGRGKESLKLMIKYAYNVLKIDKFIAKIKFDNIKSLNLFKNLGFIEISKSDYFQEVTFMLDLNKINSIIYNSIMQLKLEYKEETWD